MKADAIMRGPVQFGSRLSVRPLATAIAHPHRWYSNRLQPALPITLLTTPSSKSETPHERAPPACHQKPDYALTH